LFKFRAQMPQAADSSTPNIDSEASTSSRTPDAMLVRAFLFELPSVTTILATGNWQRLHAEIHHEALYLYAMTLASLRINNIQFDVDDALEHLFRNPDLLDRVVRQRAFTNMSYTSMECLPSRHVERGVFDLAL